MKHMALAAALLIATAGSSSWAQSPADHEAHHPNQKQSQPAPSAGQSGMMGQGMMGGPQGMMGSNKPMANMMQMMGMMRQSGSGDGMGGMETIDHVEGRIAFLRTELKITEAQQPVWNAFADALRTNAKTLGDMRSSMMSQQGTESPGLVERLAFQEKWLAARLEGTRAMKSALSNLVATFSDEQKKSADELLAPQMGMMPMMSALGGAGTTGMRMQLGKPMQ